MKPTHFYLVGEAMALLIAQEEGLLEEVESWKTGIAGAELNVAIGLTRMGHQVSFLTAVGNDSFGRLILRFLEKNGIDTSLVTIDESRSTGFMLKGRVSQGDPPIQYYRRNSAASALGEQQIEKCLCKMQDGFLHMTGIFPALSQNTFAASCTLMESAQKAGIPISFDPNLRPQLWKDQDTMRDSLNRLAGYAQIILPGVGEGKLLTGQDKPEDIAGYYLEKQAELVVVKTGASGAFAATKQEQISQAPFFVEKVVDTVGAGDGFAVGVLSGLAEGLSVGESLRRGNAIGALQVMSPGDNTGLPNRKQLEEFMAVTPQMAV